HLGLTPSRVTISGRAISDHLAQRSVQQVRGELFLSAVAYGQLLETASFVAQGYLDGRTTEELSTSFDLSPTVVESLISVVQQASANQPHQRRLQELLDSSVLASASTSAPQLGMGHPLASRSAFCAYLMRRHLFSASRAELFCAALDEATDQQSGYQRASGDIAFFAIAQDEPAGKARVDCELVTTILPFYLPNEDTVPRGTVGELKIRKAVRLAASARNQGGLLCLPDLAFLLGMGISALQRAIAKSNVFIPTRGNIMDIGRGVTHRVLIVKLYVEGHTESQIVRRTHHTYDSVASYLSDFSRVMLLVDQGLSATHIRKILQRSLSLINHYITLYNQLDVPQNQWKLNLMRQAAKKQKKKQRRTQ
ncbi:MAG: DUF1670 domain-containing protein, partial [Anaerolineales bacterium]